MIFTDGTALVSVVVGVYNHERYVVECLDSIVEGDYRNIELIIVDDASSDGSVARVREWIADHPAARVTFIAHERNQGFTRSLNEAIERVNGQYFCLIAADDVMAPDGIAARLAYLAARPDKLAVFGDCQIIDQHGQPMSGDGLERGGLDHDGARRAGQRKELLRIDALMPYNIVFHWAAPGPVFMCRVAAFDIVGRYDEELVVEDWDMYLRLAATGRLGFVDQVVAKYRVHPTNTGVRLGQIRGLDAAKTARKNLRRFDWINRLRLGAIYASHQQHLSPSPVKRRIYQVLSRVLLFVSFRAYLIKRARILRRHRVSVA